MRTVQRVSRAGAVFMRSIVPLLTLGACATARCPDGSAFDGEVCVCDEGLVDVDGRCVDLDGATAGSLSSPAVRFPWNGFSTGAMHARDAREHGEAPVHHPLRPKFLWEPVGEAEFYQLQLDDSCAGDFGECAFESPELDVGVTESSDAIRDRGAPDDVIGFVPEEALLVADTPPVGRRYFWRVRACRDERACSTWSRVRYVDVGRLPSDYNGDGFSDIALGSPGGGTSASEADEGQVHIHYGTGNGALSRTQDLILDSPADEGGARFGTSVSEAGDVNGDGFADLIVGSPLESRGVEEQGYAYVYFGSERGLAETPSLVFENPDRQAFGEFGYAVASAGDVNGDGFSDVVVGQPRHHQRVEAQGKVFVYLGAASGLSEQPSFSTQGPFEEVEATFGGTLSSAGDVNGDGYADIVVGHKRSTDSSPPAYLIYGAPDVLSNTPDVELSLPSVIAPEDAGKVSGLGDVNGDGFGDVIAGAFVFHGGRSGASMSPAQDLSEFLRPSSSLALSGGDVNGDGFGDLVARASSFALRSKTDAAIAVLFGSVEGLAPEDSNALESPEVGARSPLRLSSASVSAVGDVNGDGFRDIVVGRWSYNSQTIVEEGKAYVFFGVREGALRSGAELSNGSPGYLEGAQLGYSVR